MKNHFALLVIDVQKGLFMRPVPVYQADDLIKNLNLLIKRAREKHVPVFFIQHSNKFLSKGGDSWRIHPALERRASDRIIPKQTASAFQRTALERELRAGGLTTVVITGLVTHGCVRATCLNALKLGLKAILVKDGHSSYNKRAARLIEEWNQKLSGVGAELKAVEEIDFKGKYHE